MSSLFYSLSLHHLLRNHLTHTHFFFLGVIALKWSKILSELVKQLVCCYNKKLPYGIKIRKRSIAWRDAVHTVTYNVI